MSLRISLNGFLLQSIEAHSSRGIGGAGRNVITKSTVAIIHYDLFDIYAAKSMYDKAMDEIAQGLRFENRPQQAAAIEQSYKQEGYKGALRKMIQIASNDSPDDYDPFLAAKGYALLGDKEHVLIWLTKSYEAGAGILFLKVDPYWDIVRSDPRYADLLHRMGLSP
jgi:tetratricopeptide (TPR) repeat protein